MSQTDNAAAALEWIAQRCSQAQTPADYEAACIQSAKLARDVLNKTSSDQVTVRTESKEAALTHYSDMARVARLEAVNAELVKAVLAFIKYDEKYHSDGVMMMIDYAEVLWLARAAMKTAGVK